MSGAIAALGSRWLETPVSSFVREQWGFLKFLLIG